MPRRVRTAAAGPRAPRPGRARGAGRRCASRGGEGRAGFGFGFGFGSPLGGRDQAQGRGVQRLNVCVCGVKGIYFHVNNRLGF